MRTKDIRFISIILIAFSLIIIIIAYYMLGIIEHASIDTTLDRRLQTIKLSVANSKEEINSIIAQVDEDNIAKAKAFAIMINQSPKSYEDTESIEEIRIALGVDELMVTDENGIVIAGTSTYFGEDFHDDGIKSKFLSALTDKSFSHTISIENNGIIIQYSGVARMDKSGIVFIKTSTKYLAQTIKLAGISTITSDFPVLKRGVTAIIDIASWQYLSHTDQSFLGKTVQIPYNKFNEINKDESGNFKITLNGEKSYVRYIKYEDKFLIAIIPQSEKYARRNYSIGSLIVALPLLSLISILAIRKKLIDNGIN